jgi:hypothetical protein
MCVFYFMLTSQEKKNDITFTFTLWSLQSVIVFCMLAFMPLMIPICIVAILQLLYYRIKSRRVVGMAVLGCVLSNDDKRYTFVVLSYSGNSERILLQITNISSYFIVCRNDRDMVRCIPSARSPISIVRRIGRVELAKEIKDATFIVDHGECWLASLKMLKAQLLFSLQRPVRYIQRAWRQRRVRRRQRAAMVITSAVLDYLYRPGGPRFGKARDRFEDMSNI